MFKKILAILLMLYAAAAFAAIDVNKANAAELDSIKGIGPAISGRIIEERRKGHFKDWQDFIDRVKGVGEVNAAKFSAEGLTVNGAAMKGAEAAKKETKAETKAETKSEKTSAREEKKEAKGESKAERKSAKEEKKEARAEAKAEKKAAREEKRKETKEAKTDTGKPVASSAKAAASSAKSASARK